MGSLSDLFGNSKSMIADNLVKVPKWGPYGYDLIANAEAIEIFPNSTPASRAPRITFLFENDHLFEIELHYGSDPALIVEVDLFGTFCGPEAASYENDRGRAVIRYEDGDITIEQIRRKDDNDRVFHELRFSDSKRTAALKEALVKRKEATSLFDEGMALFEQSEYNAAIVKFQQARGVVHKYGHAYIMEAIAQIRRAQFLEAEKLADACLALSRDHRARANANGIKGLVSLYNGDKSAALGFFDVAVELDTTNPALSQSKYELETGQYSLETVAKTAARMKCLKKTKNYENNQFTENGILARGNFPSKELRLTSSSPPQITSR